MYNLVSRIQNQEFRKKVKGYSIDEVDEFLDDISDEINQLYHDKKKADIKIEELEERVSNVLNMEKSIQKALVLAQNVAEDAKLNGEKEIAAMIAEANEMARRTVEDAVREKEKIESDIQKLKIMFNSYRRRMIDYMHMQMTDFEESAFDLEVADTETEGEADLTSRFSEEYGIIKG